MRARPGSFNFDLAQHSDIINIVHILPQAFWQSQYNEADAQFTEIMNDYNSLGCQPAVAGCNQQTRP
jgi:hypothetical protein